METNAFISEVDKYSAHNYHPLPVVITRGRGVWVFDVEGKKYMDMLSAYSAVSQGHRHPKIIKALVEQAKKLTLTSRAFHNDKMGPFLKRLCELTGFEKALPMNTGAEGVETAIKAARRWGYNVKRVPDGRAEIIVCNENFHGRTTTIVGFSTDPKSYGGYGPFSPGFKIVPYGDAEALEAAINENTVAFLVEPIQGEAGVKIPPQGYLKEAREITMRHNVLLVLDEIQTGLGRTGRMFCYEYEGIRPDILIVGKALGGGVYPVSAILADKNIMDAAFFPGSHGSTFGGNPLAAAVALASLEVIIEEKLPERSAEMGEYFLNRLKKLSHPRIKDVRGKGLLMAVEIDPSYGKAREFTEKLMNEGILAKETHDQIIRFAPPLVIKREEADWAIKRIHRVLSS